MAKGVPVVAAPPPKKSENFEVCFFPEPGSFVRLRGGEDGLFTMMRQITYRCGVCGQPQIEADLSSHHSSHREKWGRRT